MLLTQAEVAQATGSSIAFAKQANGGPVSSCTYGSLSGVGDQAFAGSDAIIARKGNVAFAIVYASFGGGNHQQALEKMATDVASRL